MGKFEGLGGVAKAAPAKKSAVPCDAERLFISPGLTSRQTQFFRTSHVLMTCVRPT
jgi:hypothetical protein